MANDDDALESTNYSVAIYQGFMFYVSPKFSRIGELFVDRMQDFANHLRMISLGYKKRVERVEEVGWPVSALSIGCDERKCVLTGN